MVTNKANKDTVNAEVIFCLAAFFCSYSMWPSITHCSLLSAVTYCVQASVEHSWAAANSISALFHKSSYRSSQDKQPSSVLSRTPSHWPIGSYTNRTVSQLASSIKAPLPGLLPFDCAISSSHSCTSNSSKGLQHCWLLNATASIRKGHYIPTLDYQSKQFLILLHFSQNYNQLHTWS